MQDAWTRTNGPPGLIYAVAIDPSAPATLYAATGNAGVFKSTDGGRQWTPMNEGLGSPAALSIAIDPSHPSTIYAGTNRGVFRSDDGALTWVDSSNGIGRDPFGFAYIYALATSAGPSTEIYAGTLRGVFKTTDGGATWKSKNSGLRIGLFPAVQALAVDPVETNVVFAGAEYQGLSGTLFKSIDGGDTWTPLTVGLTVGLVSSLTMDPADHRRLYAATRGQGLFTSRDGGDTWAPAGSGVLEKDLAAVAVSASPSVVYAAGQNLGFYRSSDGGLTWEQTDRQTGSRGPRSLALEPQNGAGLWLATAGGVYHSTDRGSTWTESDRGLAASQIFIAVAHPADPRLLLASAAASGVYRTLDGGSSWSASPLGVGIASSLAMDPDDTRLAFAGMVYISTIQETGLYVTRDTGDTWELVPAFKGLVIAAIAASPERVLIGTSTGIHVSEDGGSTWRSSSEGLPLPSQILDISVHPRDQSLVFAVLDSEPQTLFRSLNGGKNWSVAFTFNELISAVAPSAAAPGLIYVATEASVARSDDAGRTWRQIPFTGNGTVRALRPHPLVPGTVYLGADLGAYRSLDSGVSWDLIGLEGQVLTSVAISNADPTHIYGGTYGSGVWSFTAVPTLSVSPERLSFLAGPDDSPPQPVSLSIQDSSGGTFAWTLQPPPWLSVTPSSGISLPVTVTAAVNLTGLTPGSYQDAVIVSSTVTTTTNSPFTMPATLRVAPIVRQYLPDIPKGLSIW